MVRTPKAVALLVATAVLVVLTTPPAVATTASSIIDAVNAERVARGLAPLQSFGDNSMAKRSNDAFVATGALHGLFKEASSWYRSAGATSVAENQARFPESTASGKTVARAWADSEGHASNQFNPSATHIAAAEKSSGGNVYYTVHVLEAGSHKPPTKSEPEPAPKPPKKPPPEPPPPAPAEQAPPPQLPAAEEPPAPDEVAEVAHVEPLDIPTPRQMMVVAPVSTRRPETPAQMRPTIAVPDGAGQLHARILGLVKRGVPGGVGEVAVLAEVVRAGVEAGAGEVAGGEREQHDAVDEVTAVATPRAGTTLGIAGLGGLIGLLVAAMARHPARRGRRPS